MNYPVIKKGIDTYAVEKCNNSMFRIIKHDGNALMRTDAVLHNDVFWSDIPPFKSAIQAYKFMKDNIDRLM